MFQTIVGRGGDPDPSRGHKRSLLLSSRSLYLLLVLLRLRPLSMISFKVRKLGNE